MGPGTDARRDGPYAEDRLTALHAQLTALHAQLMAAVEAPVSSDAWMQMLRAAARFPTYSPSNILLINTQHSTPVAESPTHPQNPVPGLR